MNPILKSTHPRFKFNLGLLLILCFTTISCDDKKLSSANKIDESEEKIIKIPVAYDQENLNLFLFDDIREKPSSDFWRWDYMNSSHPGPDTTGIEYYMNLTADNFNFYGGPTQPSLSVVTDKNKIIEFSAAVLFNLPDRSKETIDNLLDSLSLFNGLKNPVVRKAILEKNLYKKERQHYIETLALTYSPEIYGYHRMIYFIQSKKAFVPNQNTDK